MTQSPELTEPVAFVSASTLASLARLPDKDFHYLMTVEARGDCTIPLYGVEPTALLNALDGADELARRVDDILGQLGPGGYLVPAGAVKTNSLKMALKDFRTAKSAPSVEAGTALGLVDTISESKCEYCGDLNWEGPANHCRNSSGHSWQSTGRTLYVSALQPAIASPRGKEPTASEVISYLRQRANIEHQSGSPYATTASKSTIYNAVADELVGRFAVSPQSQEGGELKL